MGFRKFIWYGKVIYFPGNFYNASYVSNINILEAVESSRHIDRLVNETNIIFILRKTDEIQLRYKNLISDKLGDEGIG